MLLGLEGLQGNDTPGTDGHTLAAGHTLVMVHHSHAVLHMDGVKGTGFLTGAQAQAAIVAAQRAAAGEQGGCSAVLQALVSVLAHIGAAAGAVDHRLLAGDGHVLYAHDGSDLSGHRALTHSAEVDGSFAGSHSGGVA